MDDLDRLRLLVARTRLPGNDGSAFLVGPSLALTCAHCLRARDGFADRVTLEFPLHDPPRTVEAVVIPERFDERLDVALLRLAAPVDLPFLGLGRRPPRDAPWRSVLFPSGADDAITVGLPGDVVTEPNHRFYEVPAMELRLAEAGEDLVGVSGSPVLCGGRIVGIVSAQLKKQGAGGGARPAYERLYAVPLEEIGWPELPLLRGASRSPARPVRELDILRRRVQETWIQGVLVGATAGVAAFTVDRASRPEVLASRPVAPRRVRNVGAIPASRTQSSLYEESNGALLLLGAPGAGKTVALLELARDLLETAEMDPAAPVPVVLVLSAWSGEPLHDWIVEELRRRYQIPVATGRTWLAARSLVILLDGLDEVATPLRRACVDAFNALRNLDGLLGVAITCRREEYECLEARLDVALAVELLPLSDDAVAAWVGAAGEQLAGLRAALAGRPDLRELARNPLFLNLLAVTTAGRPADVLAAAPPEDLQRQLIGTWVDRMYEDRSAGCRFDRVRTHRYLTWLAARMVERGQTLIQVDDLQPDLLGRAGRAVWNVVLWIVLGAGVLAVMSILTTGVLLGLGENVLRACLLPVYVGCSLVLLVPRVASAVLDIFRPTVGEEAQERQLRAFARKGPVWFLGGLVVIGMLLASMKEALGAYLALGSLLAIPVFTIGAALVWPPSSPEPEASPRVRVASELVPRWRLAGILGALTLALSGGLYAVRSQELDGATLYFDSASTAVRRIGVQTWGRDQFVLSGDGRRLASWNEEQPIRVVDVASGRLVEDLAPAGSVEQVWLGADGTVWADIWVVDESMIHLGVQRWDPASGVGALLDAPASVMAVVENGALVARGDALELHVGTTVTALGPQGGGATSLLSSPTGLHVARIDASQVTVGPPGGDAVTLKWADVQSLGAGADGWIALDGRGFVTRWTVAGERTGQAVRVEGAAVVEAPGFVVGEPGEEYAIPWLPVLITSPDGRSAVVTGAGGIRTFDAAGNTLVVTQARSDNSHLGNAVFAPDGKSVLVGVVSEAEARILRVGEDGAVRVEVEMSAPSAGGRRRESVELARGGGAGALGHHALDLRPTAAAPLLLGGLLTLVVAFRRSVPRAVPTPTARLRGALRTSVAVGGFVGVGVATVSAIALGEPFPFLWELVALFSIPTALLAAAWFGGYPLFQHALLRVLLAASGRLPLRLVRLLDEASSRAFLRPVGGQHVFLHRRVMEHFAAEAQPPPSCPGG
ncbi:MAG: trypsin-like peptidase domain-containing protein [Pseudomonadota bacterium]|nr:trypsin-like peptidase domain-containing protein [Pseudomonadota bacterium]